MYFSMKMYERERKSRLLGEAIGEARGVAIGEARGEARGVAIGEARGEARGVAIGEARVREFTAFGMLRRNMSEPLIAELTGLPMERIQTLKQRLAVEDHSGS